MILFFVALAWFAGVIAAALGLVSLWPAVALTGAGFFAGAVLGRKPLPGLVALALSLVAVAGMARYDAARHAPPQAVEALAGQDVTLRGYVDSDPALGDVDQSFSFRVQAYRNHESSDWTQIDGRVLITARRYPSFAYGDRLQLTGALQVPPQLDGFDYRDYLDRRGISLTSLYPGVEYLGSGDGSALQRGLTGVRDRLSRGIDASLGEPEAALADGILLGRRSAIPQSLSDDFNAAGISHLVAISGYNVMLLAGFAVGSLAWLIGRRRATISAMALIVVYALLAGASPSVLRATLMGLVMLGAVLAGRPNSSLGAVTLAAAALTVWQPRIIDDVSFQLSVGATLGIVLLARPLQEAIGEALAKLVPDFVAAPLAENAAVTIAATLAVLPIIAASFGRVSLVSLPANLLAVPAFPLVMLASFVAALGGMVDASLSTLIGEAARLPLAYTIWVGRTASSVPGASATVDGFGATEAIVAYAALGAAAVLFLRRRRRSVPSQLPGGFGLQLGPVLLASGLVAVVAVTVWWGDVQPADARLRVTVLDVGQGDSILIQTPQGQRVIVDSGPSGSRLVEELDAVLPEDDRRIDLIVVTHPQDDHQAGFIDLLQRYDVRAALVGPNQGTTGASIALQEAIEAEGAPVSQALAGERASLGNGVELDVLAPYETAVLGGADFLNENGIVLRLVDNDISFLLTADIGEAGEDALLDAWGDIGATVLKVPHHGSDGSSTAPFIEAVDPAVAVISVGADNTYGHPAPGTRLRLAGSRVLRTDLNGRVSFETDGRRLWVDWQRGDVELLQPE